MRRWFFNLAAVVSALVLVGLSVFWVRDYGDGETFYSRVPHQAWTSMEESVAIGAGRVRIQRCVALTDQDTDGRWGHEDVLFEPMGGAEWRKPIFEWHAMGFQFAYAAAPEDQLTIVVPIWFLMVLCLPLPMIWMRRRRNRRAMTGGFEVVTATEAGLR